MTEPDFLHPASTYCGARFRARREPGCGASIRWVTLNDKPHPIDPEPSKKGSLIVVRPEGFARPAEVVLIPKVQRETYKGDLYVSHFATCSVAERFRNRK